MKIDSKISAARYEALKNVEAATAQIVNISKEFYKVTGRHLGTEIRSAYSTRNADEVREENRSALRDLRSSVRSVKENLDVIGDAIAMLEVIEKMRAP